MHAANVVSIQMFLIEHYVQNKKKEQGNRKSAF